MNKSEYQEEYKKYEGKTNIQLLQEIANKNTISDFEQKFLKYWGLEIGLKNIVITCGIVYPEGKGEPLSVHQFAKFILRYFEEVIK